MCWLMDGGVEGVGRVPDGDVLVVEGVDGKGVNRPWSAGSIDRRPSCGRGRRPDTGGLQSAETYRRDVDIAMSCTLSGRRLTSTRWRRGSCLYKPA